MYLCLTFLSNTKLMQDVRRLDWLQITFERLNSLVLSHLFPKKLFDILCKMTAASTTSCGLPFSTTKCPEAFEKNGQAVTILTSCFPQDSLRFCTCLRRTQNGIHLWISLLGSDYRHYCKGGETGAFYQVTSAHTTVAVNFVLSTI